MLYNLSVSKSKKQKEAKFVGYIHTIGVDYLNQSDIKVGPTCEEVNYLNVQRLMRDISRPKALGNLGVFQYAGQGKIKLGRWMQVGDELILCDELTETEHLEVQQLLDELGVSYIHNGRVYFRNDECPRHFTLFGTGDCNCTPPWK